MNSIPQHHEFHSFSSESKADSIPNSQKKTYKQFELECKLENVNEAKEFFKKRKNWSFDIRNKTEECQNKPPMQSCENYRNSMCCKDLCNQPKV